MNRIAARETLKVVFFAIAISVVLNMMLIYMPKVLLILVLTAMVGYGVKMIYDVERDRAERLDRLNEKD